MWLHTELLFQVLRVSTNHYNRKWNPRKRETSEELSWKEIIKVREYISHTGLIPKVIPLKGDIVPSSSEELLSRRVDSPSNFFGTTWDEMVETSLYMFWFRVIVEMFSALSAAFLFGRAFVCFVLVWLFIIWLFIRFQGVELIKI